MKNNYVNTDGERLQTDCAPPFLVHWLLQPALLVFVYLCAVGHLLPIDPYAGIGISMLLLLLCERLWPARQDWVQSSAEWMQVLMMFIISAASLAFIEVLNGIFVSNELMKPMHELSAAVWPTNWAMPFQVILGFSILQFIAYWLHRWQHRINWMWRTFGHGTHHTYTKLSSFNWNTAHPFEALFLAGPAALMSSVFGLHEVAMTSAALIMVSTAIAHTNLRLNERFIGYVLTTQSQHMHHHSSVFSQSQTNYGCAMIFWDRLFDTFSPGDTVALGDPMDGERTLWRRLVEPLK